MLILQTNPDGSRDLHIDATTAGYLAHAIVQARPGGSFECSTPTGVVRVHVHATPSESTPAHEPIEAK